MGNLLYRRAVPRAAHHSVPKAVPPCTVQRGTAPRKGQISEISQAVRPVQSRPMQGTPSLAYGGVRTVPFLGLVQRYRLALFEARRSRSCAAWRTEMARRPNASARGYGSRWRALRASTPPAPCADCGRPWAKSYHLDHVRARSTGGTDDPANLQWRCGRCHSRKTSALDGAFGNPRRRGGMMIGVNIAGRPRDPSHPWNQKS
jgi:5-methylcytosine-specific restriction endonuclease McrA